MAISDKSDDMYDSIYIGFGESLPLPQNYPRNINTLQLFFLVYYSLLTDVQDFMIETLTATGYFPTDLPRPALTKQGKTWVLLPCYASV